MLHNRKLMVATEPMHARHNNTEATAWQAHRDALYRFVLQRVSDEAAAEDIVQEVLVKAYTRQGTLKEPSKLRSWLYQITRNAIIDYFRSQRPSVAVPDELIHEATREEDNRARRELARCLVPLLDKLPEPYRQALRLAEFEGATQREVASRLGLSLSGAKSREVGLRQGDSNPHTTMPILQGSLRARPLPSGPYCSVSFPSPMPEPDAKLPSA